MVNVARLELVPIVPTARMTRTVARSGPLHRFPRHVRWSRPRIIQLLQQLKHTHRDISSTGLKRLGLGRIFPAATVHFGSYKNAVQAAGFDYALECRSRPKGYWKRGPQLQRKAVEDLARSTGKTPAQLTAHDFKAAGLSYLLVLHGDSPYKLLEAVGLLPSSPRYHPKRYWSDKRHRITAVRAVLERTRKRPTQLTYHDFNAHGYAGVLAGRSLYAVLREVGFQFHPWQLKSVPTGWWDQRPRRLQAVRWLVKKVGKPVAHLQKRDFEQHRLGGLLGYSYGNDIECALREAGYSFDALSRLQVRAGTWRKRRFVREAVERLLRQTGKRDLEELRADDFFHHGLGGLYDNYGEMWKILRKAGYKIDSADFSHRRFSGAYRYRSRHGHRCRSLEEKELDDFLARSGFKSHDHGVRYPGSPMNCDFVTADRRLWIEYAGMKEFHYRNAGRLYRNRLRRKISIARRRDLNLLVVTRKDLREKDKMLRKIMKTYQLEGRVDLPP